MRISDWSSDVCSSDLQNALSGRLGGADSLGHLDRCRRFQAADTIGQRKLVNHHVSYELAGRGSTAGAMKPDRKSDVSGKSVSVGVDLSGRRIITNKTKFKQPEIKCK